MNGSWELAQKLRKQAAAVVKTTTPNWKVIDDIRTVLLEAAEFLERQDAIYRQDRFDKQDG